MKQVFKRETLTKRKCVNSILRFYNLATSDETIDGARWYNEANTYAKELAGRYDLSIQQVVGIISAFSPQAGWQENKRYTLSFLINPNSLLRSKVQFDKARNILTLKSEAAIYNALSITDKAYKTKAFFLNILNPDIVTDVTIDRHAIAACIQHPDKVEPLSEQYSKLTKGQYDFFQRCYVEAAAEANILPQQMQAIVWIVYRRMRDLVQHTNLKDWQPFDSAITF